MPSQKLFPQSVRVEMKSADEQLYSELRESTETTTLVAYCPGWASWPSLTALAGLHGLPLLPWMGFMAFPYCPGWVSRPSLTVASLPVYTAHVLHSRVNADRSMPTG